jgi:hypothetical protein
MKPLELKNTKIALEGLDKVLVSWDRKWDNPEKINNKTALLLFKALEEAENVVRRAFYEDTKDRNCLDNCMLVGINWLRELVKKNDSN